MIVCTPVYVPPPSENVGVAATGRLITYAALATALLVYPEATAIASMVSFEPTDICEPALYTAEEVLGVVPFVV